MFVCTHIVRKRVHFRHQTDCASFFAEAKHTLPRETSGNWNATTKITTQSTANLFASRLSRLILQDAARRPRIRLRLLLTSPTTNLRTFSSTMATTAPLDDSLISFIRQSFPKSSESLSANVDAIKLSCSLYPSARYSDTEKTELNQWLITSAHIASPSEDQAKKDQRLSSLNTHLSTRTTLLGSKPSVADVALYHHIAPLVKQWSADQRTGEQGYHHIVRYVDFVQNAPFFGLNLSDEAKISIDPDDVKHKIAPIDAKAEKERKKKMEKEASTTGAKDAAAAVGTKTTLAVGKGKPDVEVGSDEKKSRKEKAVGRGSKDTGDVIAEAVGSGQIGVAQPSQGKKEKKEKGPKAAKNTPAPDRALSPAVIDLRVGHILKAVNHPNADSLYVSTIACGDAPGTDNTSEYEGQIVRTVCSGLNGLVPLEEMQGRKIVAVCNLKPVTMRGIKSAAMVLAASPREEGDGHKGPVELVSPPAKCKAGDRAYFEGWEGEPESVLNAKKKQWETLQPGFTTTDDLNVGFQKDLVEQLSDQSERPELGRLRTKDGLCVVESLKGATVR